MEFIGSDGMNKVAERFEAGESRRLLGLGTRGRSESDGGSRGGGLEKAAAGERRSWGSHGVRGWDEEEWRVKADCEGARVVMIGRPHAKAACGAPS